MRLYQLLFRCVPVRGSNKKNALKFVIISTKYFNAVKGAQKNGYHCIISFFIYDVQNRLNTLGRLQVINDSKHLQCPIPKPFQRTEQFYLHMNRGK